MNIFDKVDALAKELSLLQPMKQEDKQRLEDKFRLEFNYNSNHIEGNTLTYGETKLLLIFDNTTGSHTLREYEEMKSHDVAYQLISDWAKDAEAPLTEQKIKELNQIILVRPYWKEAITPDGQSIRRQIKVGDYKEYPNSVRLKNGEMFHYASPIDTPIQMHELIDWYRGEERNIHPVTLAAMLHYKFVRIHPFDDGNGRIARLLLNYVLLRNSLPPIVIQSADKENYLRVLNLADVGDYEPFISYVAEQLLWSLEISIDAAKGLSIDQPEDLDKKIHLLELELKNVNPEEEIQKKYSLDVFYESYNLFIAPLIEIVVPVIQKFNHFFTGVRHYVSITPASVHVNFNDETPTTVADKVLIDIEHKIKIFEHQYPIVRINTFYGSFTKGGLHSFGCNYAIEIKFDEIKYSVFVDDFDELSGTREPKLLFEFLLHRILNREEMNLVANTLGNTIFQHIDFFIKKSGIRK